MNWTCPYCNRAQTVTSAKFSIHEVAFGIDDVTGGPFGLQARAIGCANPECRQMQIDVSVIQAAKNQFEQIVIPHKKKLLLDVRIIPDSSAKPQPSYIPAPLVEDYTEACLIRDLSPKASATLSRRCIQGMIRDFAKVQGRTLFDEISALKKLVEEGKAPQGVSLDSVLAIDHIRSIGNIGAHMEKDIDLIIPVEPEEAQTLIDLIESLFEEWYVARQTRQDRFDKIKSIADQKAQLKLAPPPGQANP